MKSQQYHRCFLLLILAGIIISGAAPTPIIAQPETAVMRSLEATHQADDGGIALPGSCTRVTPGNGDVPTCCVSGYVWMDGQAIRGATVTITAPNGRQQTLITDLLPDRDQPYYRAALTGAPLNVQIGQTITITARYSSHEQTVTHVVRSGGQQVDLVLAKNYAQDYVFERQTSGQPENGKFNDPVSIEHDSNGNLYVLDRETSTVQKFDRFGNFQLKWGARGVKTGEFMFPENVLVDVSNNIYVVDTENNRIQKFSSTGEFILQIGSYGQVNGYLDNPEDIVIDRQGILYIADERGVHKFSSDGSYISSWPSVQGIKIYSLGIETTGNIVAYTFEPSVSIFSPEGTLLRSWSTSLYPSQYGSYRYLAYDMLVGPDNEVYLSQRESLLEVYTQSGEYIRTIGMSQRNLSLGDGRGFVSATLNVDNVVSIIDATWSIDKSSIKIHRYEPTDSFLGVWGAESKGVGQFDQPYKVRVVGSNIMVFDAMNDRIEIFDLQFSRTRSISISAYAIYDVEFDSEGYIYIIMSSELFSEIVINKFNNQGQMIQTWTDFNDAGYITRGVDDTLYLLTRWGSSQRVIHINQNGAILSSWTLPPLPEDHYGYDHIAVDAEGVVYLTDGPDVYKFTAGGNFVRSWTSGDAYIEGLVTDNQHNIIVIVSTWNDHDYAIHKFSSEGMLLGSWGKLGYDYGELHIRDGNDGSFSSPAIDAQGRVYVADVINNRLQIFLAMEYTRPIGTITWLSRRSLVQGQDTLTVVGRAADSDEDGTPSSFTYRWYRGNTLLGTGATLSVAASNLPIGTYDLSLEVVDDEGEVSPRVSTPIDVSPPPQTAWTFLLYLVADSYPDGAELLDAMDAGFGKGLLARLQQQQRTTPNAQVQVVVQIDAYGTGNTRRLVLESNGTWREVWRGERPMDDADTLADFVRWGKQEKPASHYALTIASHGNGYQGVAWDDTSGGNSYLTMAEIGQALENASGSGAAPLDVLHLDACSMGLLDVAYELRDQVRYLVVSQNLGWSFFLQDRYRSRTGGNTTPRQLAEGIVTVYADYAELESRTPTSRDQYPYTVSLLDLRRAAATASEVDALARELGAYATSGTEQRGVLAGLRKDSQKFDSPVFDYRLTTLDEYVDLVDWAERLRDSEAILDPAVKIRATNVINAVRGTNGLVVTQRNSGAILRMPQRYGGQPTNLSGAHGISVYYPHDLSASVPTVIWYRYKNDQLFQFTADTQWNEFLRVGNTALPAPTTPQPEPGKPGMILGTPWSRIFIPFAVR